VSYREHLPPPALAPWLECVWERQGTGRPVRVLPDGCIDVIWIEGVGALVAGPNTVAFMATPPSGARVVGARLRPGAASALLDVIEPEGLRDASPPAAEVLGIFGVQLEETIIEARDPLMHLSGVLLERARRAPRPDPLVQEAVAGLRRPGTGVAPLAESLGVSERQLRRRMAAAVGYGPKLLSRVLRLQRALSLARGGDELARAALGAGYADQAHFSGDCRALAGVSPGRLLGPR
jgi:AraC-like DNA-binding protein